MEQEDEEREIAPGVCTHYFGLAGRCVGSHLKLPPSYSSNPVICVYYSGVADGWDKSLLFQTCSWALSAGDRTLSPDEKPGLGKLN